MSEILSYKSFSGSMEASVEDNCLIGQILFIQDVITYEGQTVAEVSQAFQSAVDRYLEHCREIGKEPNKPYSGSFNVRVGSDRHKWAAHQATAQGVTLNQFVCAMIDEAKSKNQESTSGYAFINNLLYATSVGAAQMSGSVEPSYQNMIDPYLNTVMQNGQRTH